MASHVFDDARGVLPLINLLLKGDYRELTKLVKCKTKLLELIRELVAKLSAGDIRTYGKSIVETCERLYRTDKASAVQTAAFGPLVEVISRFDHLSGDQQTILPKELVLGMVKRGCDKLFEAKSKVRASVRGQVMYFVGLLCEHFGDSVLATGEGVKKVQDLLRTACSELKEQMSAAKDKRENAVIEGAFKGLAGILVHFPQPIDASIPEGQRYGEQICSYVLTTIDPKNLVEMSRYAAPRAALQLLARHAEQFQSALGSKHKLVYGHLTEACNHKNGDIRTDGFAALESFLKEVSNFIVASHQDGKTAAANETFKFLFVSYKKNLEVQGGSSRNMSVSIRGFGYLAEACRLLASEKDLANMLEMIAQPCNQLYASSSGDTEESLANLPSYITAVSNILRQMTTIDPQFVDVLERLMIILIAKFPSMHTRSRWPALHSLADVCTSLATKGEVLGSLIGKVTYQGLLYVCSCRETDATTQESAIDAYVELFRNLVCGKMIRQTVVRITDQEGDRIHAILYAEIVQNILQIIGHLNLQTTKASEDQELVSDFISGREAVNANDWTVLLVLVKFSNQFFRSTPTSLFLPWLPVIVEQLTRLWAEPGHELVSGIYSLLRLCVEVGNGQQYFNRVESEDAETTRETCVLRLGQFAKELQSLFRQFKGELLASSVGFVLSLPRRFVEEDLGAFVPAMTVALKLGLSYTPLASTAVDALERWIATLPGAVFEPHLSKILPALEAYLVARATVDAEDTGGFQGARRRRAAQRKSSGATLRRRRAAATAEAVKNGGESSSGEITDRIVQVLGKMGGQYNNYLLDVDQKEIGDASSAEWLSWDHATHLNYTVPFEGGLRVKVSLDGLLPRITQLAQNASDRQTKIAACEVLHSLVIYMTGQTTQRVCELGKLFSKVFPVLLNLACDVEKIAKQLFEPLVLQLICWFSKSQQYENEMTAALLNAIFDGLSHHENSALRDFSAICVKTFVKWTIKQTSDKDLRDNPSHIRSLLLRIYSLFADPGVFKRLGGALAVNSFYREFRDVPVLVDQYCIEMLVVMIQSLRHADNDHSRDSAAETTSTAIGHLLKMVVDKKDGYRELLSSTSSRRRLPPGITEAVGTADLSGADLTTDHLSQWAFNELTRHERLVRKEAINVFMQVTENPKAWVAKHIGGKGGAAALIAAIEQGTHLKDADSRPTLLHWLSRLESALDVYIHLVGHGLLHPQSVWVGANAKTSHIWETLSAFVATLLDEGVTTSTLFKSHNAASLSPQEVHQLQEKRCYVAV
jgi:DNA-dependent protein kinase catalytic subunit